MHRNNKILWEYWLWLYGSYYLAEANNYSLDLQLKNNCYVYGVVWQFEAQNCLPAMNLIRSTKLHLTTEPPISCRCCYRFGVLLSSYLSAGCALGLQALWQSFGCSVGSLRLWQCAWLRSVGYLSRPKKKLQILFHNPVTNLHIYFNPKYNLLFLYPSLWSGTQRNGTKRGLKSLINLLYGLFFLFGIVIFPSSF